MSIVIHNCDTLLNFSPDNGTISLDIVGMAPITPNLGCVLWQIPDVYAAYLRLNQLIDLTGATQISFWYKTSDATKSHSLAVRTDYLNYNDYDFTAQLVTGAWILVTIDLTKPTTSTGTINFAAINNLIWSVGTLHTLMTEELDEIEAASAPTTTTYTLTVQAGVGGTTNPVPAIYGPYPAGSSEIITAISSSGYSFEGWLLDGVVAGTINPKTVIMDANHTLQATFVATPTGETLLYQSNFAGGTIDPFQYLGDATGIDTVLPAAQDPLGQGKPCCKLMHTTTAGDRVSIGFYSFGGSKSAGWTVYGSIRINTTQTRPSVTDWTGIAYIRHPDLYGTGSSLWYAQLDIFNGILRLRYFDNGAMQMQEWSSGVGMPQPNVAETYELYVKTGNGNGIVTLSKNGIVLFSKTDCVNSNITGITPSGSIGSLEIGTAWGAANAPVYVYNITVMGTTFVPFPTIAVAGTIVDASGTPIPQVGVKAGSEIDPTVPWNVHTFYAEVYTDTGGNFQFTDDPSKIIPELRIIKLNYGDPNEPVGSLTRIQNLQTPPNGTLNLGKITLQNRTPIQLTTFPTGTYWTIRSILIFPFGGKPYDSVAYVNQLALIKSKGLPFNTINIRLCPAGDTVDTMTWDNSIWGPTAGMIGVDAVHAAGFQALVSINSYNGAAAGHGGITTADPAWMAAYKTLVLALGQECITHKVEYFLIEFENYTFAGQETAAWVDIVNSLRALPGWNTKIGVTMNVPEWGADYTVFQNEILADQALWSICDILHFENWTRLSTVYDATEPMIINMWQTGQTWDGYHPNYAIAFAWIKSIFPNALLIMNNAFHNGDGCAIYPWSGRAFTTIVNEEAQALAYKATFDFYQTVALDGWNMEHYSFDPTTESVDSCFNGMYSEQFIKAGLLAHSTAPVATHILVISSTANGTTDPVPGSYSANTGAIVSVSAIPSTGYMLDHWELDGVSVGNVTPYSVIMDKDHTLLAVFIVTPPPPPATHNLTISTTVGGTTKPTPGVWNYNEGTTIQVTAVPDNDYSFDHWELDSIVVGNANPYSVTMNADHTLHVVFKAKPTAIPLWQIAAAVTSFVFVGIGAVAVSK